MNDSSRTIPLRNWAGEVVAHTLVDADVYEWAGQRSWYRTSHGYVSASEQRIDGRSRTVRLHRLILDEPPGLEVDHINRDKLDNRRSNLRLVTSSQNQQNCIAAYGQSGVRGVSWHKGDRRWEVRICVDGRRRRIGGFRSLEEAATAIAAARLRLHPYAPVVATGARP